MQFGANHLAHFLLFQLRKPTLMAASTPKFNSRVVALSSSNHRMSKIRFDDLHFEKGGYDPFLAYGQAKTANVSLASLTINSLLLVYHRQGEASMSACTHMHMRYTHAQQADRNGLPALTLFQQQRTPKLATP